MSVNKVILLGRLGNDPEMKTLPTGNAVCNLSVATSEKWMKDGKKQEKTEWHRVVSFGKQAETLNQYLSKGSEVYIEGKLQTRSWEDNSGVKRYSTEIVMSSFSFVGGNAQKNESLKDAHAKHDTGEYDVSTNTDFASDDIPF